MSPLQEDTQPSELHLIEPLEREQRLYEKVVDKILEMIAANSWPSGHRLLPERELAEAFGVSRTVVREAVKALEARGVLESATSSGVYVRAADSRMISRSLQTYLQLSNQSGVDMRLAEIRRILEVEVAALAAQRATPEQKAKFRPLCQEMRANVNAPQKMAELDFRFHALLAEATQNELFGVLLAPLIEQLHHLLTYAWEGYGERPLEVIFQHHEAIAAAVELGDADAARRATVEHMAYSQEVLESLIALADKKTSPASGK
jgi:GntR family transcriptional repressor for pyruvate dehydrogenase complex